MRITRDCCNFAAMKILDSISTAINRVFGYRVRKRILVGADLIGPRLPYAYTLYLNAVELLTDICNDVTLTYSLPNDAKFVAYKRFFDRDGQLVLNYLYEFGYVVIGHTVSGEGAAQQHLFRILSSDEYIKRNETKDMDIIPRDEGVEVYVMVSKCWATTGMSDKQILEPVLSLIDNTLNASNTISERLGTVIIGSPKNVTNSPAPYVLRKEDKEEMEKEISENYGALAKQKQMLILPREMNFQTMSLATLDIKTREKVQMAMAIIADRIKVPANQIALIDSSSSKTLSNGTEMREGDYNKYQSFERLLNKTFILMASYFGMAIDYTIYNKPTRGTI